MKFKAEGFADGALLRQQAEDHLRSQKELTDLNLQHNDVLKLVHELEVHQIELEMQKEELLIAKERAEQSEKKYIQLYDFAPSGYLSLSNDGTITELNFVAADFLGEERSKLIDKQLVQFLDAASKVRFLLFLNDLFTTERKQTCEVVIASDGPLSIHVLIEGLVSKSGDFCNLNMTDVTDKNLRQLELVKAKEHAERCDCMKSAFLANMSHEIRTPMNGILGFAELLKNPNLSGDEQHKFIQIIEKSGVRMLKIINDIVDISKIEAGLMKIYHSETNINEQIEELYSFFRPEVEEKGMTLHYTLSLSSQESIIYTDGHKVFAILTNLVKNAVKYTMKGSIHFGYTIKGDYLEFFVKDTGVGIPKDRQDAVFERFIQADLLNAHIQHGAGLGLSISKAYVEMLGGKIWNTSEEGNGSCFYFTLPYHTMGNKMSVKQDVEVIDINTLKKNLKILIVEDDDVSRMLLTITLKRFSQEIVEVKTGGDAVEVCRANPDIDLVLMDLQLPELNGNDATMQIRQFNKDVVIIAQTAYGLTSDRLDAITAGCNDYISKPIDGNALVSLIQKHLKV